MSWVKVLRVPNYVAAEMWKEFFDGEQIGARVLPEKGNPYRALDGAYGVYVPEAKIHVAEEALRKLQ